MTHLSFDQLSELAERADVDVTAGHLAECAECRATLERIRGLVRAARDLPRDIEPPAEVWAALRDRVAGERGRRSVVHVRRWWHNGWLATAAAVVLVLGTATFMAALARGKSAKAKAMMVATPPQAPPRSTPALLAVDRNYVATIRELREALATQRSELSPGTVATLERSLRVIDAAIAEARTALAADPANQALVDILAGHYAHEVDLLQRATELSSSD